MPAIQRQVATKEAAPEKGEEARHALAGIKFDQKVPLFSKRIAAGPFWIQGSADLNVSGTIKRGEGGVLSFSAAKEEGPGGGETHLESEFSTEFETEYGKIEVGGSAEALSVGFAGKHLGVSFKFNPSVVKTFEAKFKIDSGPLREQPIGSFKFSGSFGGSISIVISPNFAKIAEYLAEKAAERAATTAAEEEVTVTLAETGEEVVATSAGTAALVGVGAGATAIAMELGVLYEIGKANQEGHRLGVRHSYCEGFATALSQFTEPMNQAHPVRAYNKGEENRLTWALGLDWKGSLKRAEQLSIDSETAAERSTASYRAWWAGKAAATQMVMGYISDNGAASWQAVIAQHLEKYGASRQERQDAYYRILRRDEGDEPPVIPI